MTEKSTAAELPETMRALVVGHGPNWKLVERDVPRPGAGASSGVRLVGVQVAKAVGASTVIGTTRRESMCQVLTEHGLDEVIVTDGDDLSAASRSASRVCRRWPTSWQDSCPR